MGSAEDKKVRGRYLLLNTFGMHLVFYFCCLVPLPPFQGPIEGQPTAHAHVANNASPSSLSLKHKHPNHFDEEHVLYGMHDCRDEKHNKC